MSDRKTTIADICFIILSGMIILIPYFLNVNFEGNDTVFHYRCIEVMARYSIPDILGGMYLKDSILNGMLMDNFVGSAGYGAGIFYPPLSHVVAVLIYKILSFAGVSLILSFRLAGVLCMILSGISMYVLGKKVYPELSVGHKDEKPKAVFNPAFLASVLYMSALYHISDHMSRDAAAEYWTFVFIPVFFISIICLLKDDHFGFIISFVISCVGFVHSHLVLTVYMAFFFGAAILISIKDIAGKNVSHCIKRISAIVVGLMISILLCLPFFVRLMQNRSGASYYVFDGEMTTVELLNRNRMSLTDFFVGMKNGNIAVHCNLIFLALVLTAVFIYFYPGKNERLIKLKSIMKSSPEERVLLRSGILFFGLSCILSSKLINWSIMPHFLQIIQFPWRLLVFQTFGMTIIAMAFFMAFSKLFNDTAEEEKLAQKLKLDPGRIMLIMLISCIAYTAIEQFSNYMLIYDRDYRDYLTVYDYNDYLPMNSIGKYIEEVDADCVYTSKYTIPAVSSSAEEIVFGLQEYDEAEKNTGDSTGNNTESIMEDDIDNDIDNSISVEIPRLYYQGYTVETEDGSHNKTTVPYYETDRGFLGINVPPGSVVTVRFTGTKEEITANRISLVAFVVFMLYCTLGLIVSVRKKPAES